jgi:hypothetical protein
MKSRVAALTVRVAVPLTEPEVAVIVDVPTAMLVARPWLPAELLIVATFGVPEVQVTEVVMF